MRGISLMVLILFLALACAGKDFSSGGVTTGGNDDGTEDGGPQSDDQTGAGAEDAGLAAAAGQAQAGQQGGQGSSGQGGSAAGGEGGEGSAAQGGQAGQAQGGSSQGGAAQGGTSGAAQGGQAQGGAAGAGADGGAGAAASCDNPMTYYVDHDGDGYGGDIHQESCEAPENTARVDGDLTTGEWLTTSGDCFDDSEFAKPGAAAQNGPYTTSDGPSYDWDCDGTEEPVVTELWVNEATNCELVAPYQCEGNGALMNGNRSETISGANDLCGGAVRTCLTNTSAGPCVFAPSQPNACK